MSLFNELKRRNVFRVGIAYLVAAWLLAQVADFVFEVVSAPEGALRALVVILALGLIPTVIFAWAYEMTPEGVKKASEIDPDQSITPHTGKKLDFVIIGLLVVAIGFLVFDRFLAGPEPDSITTTEAIPRAPAPSEEETQNDAALPATSIAVLPFANRSNQDDDLYFTDGIHDDLLTQLAKIHDMTVISRTSVMEYRNSPKNLREIGAELNVSTILEGGVQKVGDRVRINAQLIEVATDRHLWAETFDRELTAENVFELQSEIARKIVRAVSVQLSPEEERLLDQVPTQNLAAYEAYLRARDVFYGANYSRSQEEAALPLIERAIELDPNYADAQAMLSHIYAQLYWRGIDWSEELLDKYRSALERVEALDPGSPVALRARANYHYRVENDYRRSLELLEQALALAPGNVDIHGDIALSLRRLGRWDESIASFRRALQLDPANRFYRLILLETMTAQKRWQDIVDNSVSLEDAQTDELDIQVTRAVALLNLTGSLEPLEKVFERMPPTPSNEYFEYSAYVPWMMRDPDAVIAVLNNPIWLDTGSGPEWGVLRLRQLADAWRLKGDESKARALYEEAVSHLDSVRRGPVEALVLNGTHIAMSLANLGRFDEALALADEIVDEFPLNKDAMQRGWLLAVRAQVRGLAGEMDGALEDLQLSLSTPSPDPVTRWNLHYDPNWDFMRDDQRFVQLATPDNLIQ